jgi:ankyrin repeat protein
LHDACIARGIKLPVEVSWQNLPQNIASAEALETLIRKAPLEKICACFDKNISVNFRFKNASTPLIVAAEEGRFDVAKFLVDSGAGVNAQSDLHYTALHWAAFYGHRQIVELLLKNGANVNIKDKTGSTPLVLSLVNGHRHIAATMLSSGNHVDKSKLIDIAKKQGMADIVKMLKNQPDYAAP